MAEEIPWASWAARLGERLGLGDAAGALASAVTAITAREPGAPDALGRAAAAARALGAAAGSAAACAWAIELGAVPRADPPGDPEAAAPEGAPPARELAALWSAAALLAGEPPAPYQRFGIAAAPALALLSDLGRLWLDPAIPDLARPARTTLLSVWLADPALRGPLLYTLAGERASPSRRFEAHALLAGAPFRAGALRALSASLAEAREVLPEEGAPALRAAAIAFLGELEERGRFFEELMSFRDLLSAGRRAPAEAGLAAAARRAASDARRDVGAALELLSEGAPWTESWEVQRFGVAGSQERPVGHRFVRGVILQALLEMGEDVREEAARLLLEVPPGEARHYGGFRGVPPDADVLGLLLELAAATGAAEERVETWIEVMLANVAEDGAVPTWFYRGPAGPTTDAPEIAWAGDDCTGVSLRLLSGLLARDARRFAPLVEANARRVLARARDGVLAGSYYYDELTTALLFQRFAGRCRDQGAAPSLRAEIDAVEAELRARAARSQRLDGGWGSPLRTAAALEGAALRDGAAPGALLLLRAMRYLGEHQLADGSWPGEPFYPVPLKDGRAGHHGGRALSAALCARSLSRAEVALARALDAGEGSAA